MPYFVYIIYSRTHGYFYKGSTDDPMRRLQEHNNGRNTSTKGKGPWELVFVRMYAMKLEAQHEERRLKRTNTNYLQWYIQQPFNEVAGWNDALSRLD